MADETTEIPPQPVRQEERKYVFKDYDPRSPELFSEEAGRVRDFLKETFPELKVGFFHFGSSAAKIGGKSVIDYAIVVPKEKMEEVSRVLQENGYVRDDSGGEAGKRLFHTAELPDGEGGKKDFHGHVYFEGNRDLAVVMAFTHLLQAVPELAVKYEEAKKEAAEKAAKYYDKGDLAGARRAYMATKTLVINQLNDLVNNFFALD